MAISDATYMKTWVQKSLDDKVRHSERKMFDQLSRRVKELTEKITVNALIGLGCTHPDMRAYVMHLTESEKQVKTKYQEVKSEFN